MSDNGEENLLDKVVVLRERALLYHVLLRLNPKAARLEIAGTGSVGALEATS
jgi:hypothetical protein